MKKTDLRNPALAHSGGERVLQGKILPFCNSPVKAVVKHKGDVRVVVFENGMSKQLTKAQLKGFIHGAIASHQRSEMRKTIQPTGKKEKVTMKIGGLIKGIERTFESRERAVKMLEEIYGPNQVRGTRFSKISRFGQSREAVRSALKAQQLAQNEQRPVVIEK